MSRTTSEIAAPDVPKALLAPPPGSTPEPPRESQSQPPTEHRVPKRRIWLWLVSLVLLALLAWFFWPGSGAAATGRKASGEAGKKGGRGPANTPVVAVHAKQGDIGVYVTGLGGVTPINTITIKSRVDGQLVAVHFKEGDEVKQGDPLIDIDPRPYQAVVEQTEGQLQRDQALLANARVDQTRYATLLAQDAIPEQQLATQQALVKQYEGTVKNDQGLVDAARVNLAYTHILAPISGVVGLRLVDPGNIVHASDANGMLVLTQLRPISVIFTVAEDQLAPIVRKVRAGQKLAVDAYDRELKTKLATGYLATVDNEIDQTTGTLKLRAIFANENRSLFPNQFVNARLLVQEKTGVTLLQSAAIQRNAQNTYVYLIKPDQTVTVRDVNIGTTEAAQTEVTSGLVPGDLVVMTGVDKLEEGSKVTPHVSEGQ